MNKNKLIEEIREAFQHVPYPGDTNISYTHKYKYEDYEGIKVEKFFKGKKWQDTILKSLKADYKCDESACSSFMSAQAVKYYLPAYMVIGIEEEPNNDSIALAAIHAIKVNRKKLDFSEKQREVIASFFNYMNEKGIWI